MNVCFTFTLQEIICINTLMIISSDRGLLGFYNKICNRKFNEIDYNIEVKSTILKLKSKLLIMKFN